MKKLIVKWVLLPALFSSFSGAQTASNRWYKAIRNADLTGIR